MEIIDGKKVSNKIIDTIKKKVSNLKIPKKPTLAVIYVGDDPASAVYVSKKEKMAHSLGFNSFIIKCPIDTTKEELISKIDELNEDKNVNAVLLQLPLPKHLNSIDFLTRISPKKDVDGFTPENIGYLNIGKPKIIPCTVLGVLKLLDAYNISPDSKNILVVGRSNIVGKPLATLLTLKNATVTLAHSKTKNIKSLALNSDIIISAVGKPNLITADMINKGAVIIDVGISRLKNGKIVGDVDFENVSEIASFITPVPGGVGPMTIAILMQNTFELFCIQNSINSEEIG